jgi:hypothetical protein
LKAKNLDDMAGRRSHDTTWPGTTRSPTHPPSSLPPNGSTFSDETSRAPVRIPSDDGAPATAPTPAPALTAQKRLAMFTEKLSSSTSSFARSPAQLLPGSRSHSQHPRTDSQLRENAGSPAPLIAPSTSGGGSSKVHTSPSKVRCIREPVLFLSFSFSIRLFPACLRLVMISYDGTFRDSVQCARAHPLRDVAPGSLSPSHHLLLFSNQTVVTLMDLF